MLNIERLALRASPFGILLIAIASTCFLSVKIPEALALSQKESMYFGLTASCEAASYDWYNRMGKYPSDTEAGKIELDCSEAVVSCLWGDVTEEYIQAPLWSYKCEGKNDTARN